MRRTDELCEVTRAIWKAIACREQPERDACKTCVYWQPPKAHGSRGECRVNPPTLIPRDGAAAAVGLVAVAAFPETEPDTWCGLWDKKRES